MDMEFHPLVHKVKRKPNMSRKIALAACIAASLALTANPAAAQYRRYQNPDPGPAIALGLFGAIAGAAINAQAPPVYAPPQDEYNDCAEGFYWDGNRCEAED
jgi:hypothetical protein